jgi:SAM-dependent methyltransferase
MFRKTFILAALVVVTWVAASAAAVQPDDEAIWRTFIAWFKAAPAGANPFEAHAAALDANGIPKDEIQRRMRVLMKLLNERSDWVALHFDKVFAQPLTGVPERDGFSAAPSALLVKAIMGVRPGVALDAGMGQGRNAVYLAREKWNVTGFDLSSEAVAAAARNAREAGVPLTTAVASYGDFDFGAAKWDLIVLAFAWAPVEEPGFVAKLHRALRPGGRVVFEHFVDDPRQPRPPAVHPLKPGQLRQLFGEFGIDFYEEVNGVGDWGGPGSPLVRMIARKNPT